MNVTKDFRIAVMHLLDVAFPLADAGLILNGMRTVFAIGYDLLIRKEGYSVGGAVYILVNIGLLAIALASLVSLRFYSHPIIPSRPPTLPSTIVSIKTSEYEALSSNMSSVNAWILNIAAVIKPPKTLDHEIRFNTCDRDPCIARNNWKPPRTHHCSSCGACRVGFDHHCPWIGTCLTTNLLSRFALFLTCIALAPITSLAPLFMIPAPHTIDLAAVNAQFSSSTPLSLLFEDSSQFVPAKYSFRDTILPSRLRTAYIHSRSSQQIQDAWWDRWYSWFLVMGPIGRVPFGTLWGVRELEIIERQYKAKNPGEDIAHPGVSLVLTAGYGLLFSLFAFTMCIITIRHAQKGMTTLEAQFSEGSIIYPREPDTSEENEASNNMDPKICIWMVLAFIVTDANSSTSDDHRVISTTPSNLQKSDSSARFPRKFIATPLILSPERLDTIHLYSADHAMLGKFLYGGLQSTVQFFLPPSLDVKGAISTSTSDSEGKWGGWKWPMASEALTKIAMESLLKSSS